MAGTIEKIKAKVDQALHKDKTTDTAGTHTGTHGTTGSGLTGSHGTTGSGLTGTHNTHGTTGTYGSDPTGPHDSHLANKADPRVDSDRYGAAGNTSGAGGYGTGSGLTGSHGTTGSGLTGTHNTHGTTGTYGSDPTGPHDSHLANKADPRVDSDHYGTTGNTAGAGGYGTGQYGSSTTGTHNTGSGLTGSHGTHNTGSGLTGSHGTSGYSDPTGPHDSHLANKADPRVDSDRYGAAGNTSGAGGYGTGQYGSSTTGTHNTGSGLTGSHATHGTTHNTPGSGNSANTAGPHNSDLLNKLDPRVDSDLDHSKTVGGNATYR